MADKFVSLRNNEGLTSVRMTLATTRSKILRLERLASAGADIAVEMSNAMRIRVMGLSLIVNRINMAHLTREVIYSTQNLLILLSYFISRMSGGH